MSESRKNSCDGGLETDRSENKHSCAESSRMNLRAAQVRLNVEESVVHPEKSAPARVGVVPAATARTLPAVEAPPQGDGDNGALRSIAKDVQGCVISLRKLTR